MTADMQQTRDGQVVGTPNYMSPEQALGKDVDHRTDLFSLGMVLYQLTTGQLPFSGSSFAETVDKIVHAQPPAIARLNYDVPPELERITLKCLQKSPDRRYQSARELMVDLRNLARELEHGSAVSGSSVLRRVDLTQTAAGGSGSSTLQPVSLEQLKSSDVLLNYAAIDDQPLLEGRPGWVSQLHQNLLTCDAVLVYYGTAPRAWVDIKLRELLKAAGYGRENAIQVQAVYIAPPDDRRKDRFRSHQAAVIRQAQDFAPNAELDAFVGHVKEACA